MWSLLMGTIYLPTDLDDDGDVDEELMDQKELTKKDIHTINEQKRRDNIKVLVCGGTVFLTFDLIDTDIDDPLPHVLLIFGL